MNVDVSCGVEPFFLLFPKIDKGINNLRFGKWSSLSSLLVHYSFFPVDFFFPPTVLKPRLPLSPKFSSRLASVFFLLPCTNRICPQADYEAPYKFSSTKRKEKFEPPIVSDGKYLQPQDLLPPRESSLVYR